MNVAGVIRSRVGEILLLMKRHKSTLIFGLVIVFAAASSAVAQPATTTGVTAEMRTAANDAYQKQEWAIAAERYQKIVAAEEKNAGAHYRLGMVLLNLDRAKDAQAHLEQAMSISPNAVFGLALARTYARTGNKDKMYDVFEQSLKLGGISSDALNNDKDFVSVKAEPKFADYVKKLDAVANPCRSRPEYRQFDFWVGEWLPRNPQGVTVGTSSIQSILNGCIVFENWETPVSAGKSFNLFDTRDGKWHQTWVDGRGLMTHYVGGLVDGNMVLVADTVTGGKKSLARMTFSKLPDGNVRQHGESSTDDGKTWTTTFDFTYVRKP